MRLHAAVEGHQVKLREYSRLLFELALGAGVAIALALCVQYIRTWYAESVLVPQQAEHGPERKAV